MKNNFLLKLLVPAALLVSACSDNKTLTTEDTTGSGQLSGVSADIFDLPSSVASTDASVELESNGLARVSVTDENAEIAQSLAGYAMVPAYVAIANEVKDSVRALIEKIAAADLPETYEGKWGELDVKLASADSLFDGETGKALRLSLSKDGVKVMHLNYVKNARSQYRGSCYFKSQDADSTTFLMRFNSFNAGVLGKRLSLWVTRPNSVLEDAGAPSALRIRAVQTPKGRVIISGVSYHPNFAGDEFWTEGAKVYGFRIVSNPEKDQAILRVAFADASEIEAANFFETHSMDKAVAKRAAEIWAKYMESNPQMANLVFYSIEKEKVTAELGDVEKVLAIGYKSERTIESFNADDLKKYLSLNSNEILTGTDSGSKGLYYHVMIKQPIFLKTNATIVGFEGQEPSEFSVESTELEDASTIDESLEGLEESEITEEISEEEVEL